MILKTVLLRSGLFGNYYTFHSLISYVTNKIFNDGYSILIIFLQIAFIDQFLHHHADYLYRKPNCSSSFKFRLVVSRKISFTVIFSSIKMILKPLQVFASQCLFTFSLKPATPHE